MGYGFFPRYKKGKWRDADDAARDAYAAELARLLDPIRRELEARGLRKWGNSSDYAVRAIVTAIHAAIKKTVGVSASRGGRVGNPLPWWNDALEAAAADYEAKAGALSAAAASGRDTRREAAAVRDARAAYDRLAAAARARFFEWRLAAARDDPRALAVVYDELREHLGEKRARGGRGTAHVWRVISAAGGGLVTGDAMDAALGINHT